jgi:hypothetical protein
MRVELVKDVTNQSGSVMRAGLVVDVPAEVGLRLVAEGDAIEVKDLGDAPERKEQEERGADEQPIEDEEAEE